MFLPTVAQAFKGRWRLWSLTLLVMVLLVALGTMFFARSRTVMAQQMRMTLRSTAAAAAMQFDGASLANIHTAKDMHLPVFRDAVHRLFQLRQDDPSIRFAYILRPTSDAQTLEFVADADSLSSPGELDINKNGIVDDNEKPSFPGDQYDVSAEPTLRDEAFLHPTSDVTFTYDQWGMLISGYAPIHRFDNGKTVAVLGIDMRADDFLSTAYSIFSPGAFFAVMVAIVCLVSGFMLLIIRKQLETLRLINAERTGLLQLTFHELGEPLTIFKWSLESIKEKSPDESFDTLMPEHIKNMEIGIERISAIIDALRGAEQVELKTLAYHPVNASLSKFLHDVSERALPLLAHRHQTLEVRCDASIKCMLDPKWIAQVMGELIKNAMSYSSDSGVIIVSAQSLRGGVKVSVADSGVGIPSKDLPHIFEKFRRGSNAGMYTPSGTGLSLYTAKGIVAMAGGKMWVESTEGKGTVVFFTLPVS